VAENVRTGSEGRWLLLFYQVPPKPPYLRVKLSRRLAKIGALAVKPTVYVLPKSDGALEDLQWVARELAREGGEATICDARLVEGLRDDRVERMFNESRSAEYRKIRETAERAAARSGDREAVLLQLHRRLEELRTIDFFHAPGRREAETALSRLLPPPSLKPASAESRPILRPSDHRRRTWVTRQGIHIDRIACAWLIRGFIDPQARFRFVPAKGSPHRRGELRFDMFDGEFTHEGENCSFETLVGRFGLDDPALQAVAEIVHDIDLKDRKFRREEAPGLERLIAGLCMSRQEDADRLEGGTTVFQSLYEFFRRKRS